MDPKGSVMPPGLPPPPSPPVEDFALDMEVWEPPFERWLRMADDLLRESQKYSLLRHDGSA